MLITDPPFKRKIQKVATTDKATWQFLFFWAIMNHYPRWFPCLLLAIFEQFSVYQRLNRVLNPCCPQRSALSTRFSVILSLARRLLLPGMGEVTMKRGCLSLLTGSRLEGLSCTPLSKFSECPPRSQSLRQWEQTNRVEFQFVW